MKRILGILSVLYWGITTLRNRLYDRGVFSTHRSALPVISVGNITAGGNGKTPLVQFLVGMLRERGHSPVVLSRGYGGRVRGPHLLSTDDSAVDVGDEPLLLLRSLDVPVVISRDRVKGARYIETLKLGSLIVLDDGFQHRRLARDVDIVCISAGGSEETDEFMRGEMLPLGRFREDREAAFMRADIVVLADRRPVDKRREPSKVLLAVIPQEIPVFRSTLQGVGVFSLATGERLEPCDVALFCGIANPAGVGETLASLSFKVGGEHYFNDHHPFSDDEIARLRAQFPNLPLVCTEKDGVKIRESLREGIFAIKVRTEVTPADAFIVQVLRSIVRGKKVAGRGIEGQSRAMDQKRSRS